MSRWRTPGPGERVITLDRWQIEAGDWDLYVELCRWPNRWDHARQEVSWIVPEATWLWMVLRWPGLDHYPDLPRNWQPATLNPQPPRLIGDQDEDDQTP